MDSLPPPPPPIAPDRAFAVDFGPPINGRANADLDRRGQLVVQAVEPRFLFTGNARKSFGVARESLEFPLQSGQIRNVYRQGAAVVFSTTAGKSGAKRTPFVFTCANEDDATAIVELLPSTQDPDFAASAGFGARLRSLPDASAGLGSITNLVLLANAAVFVVMGFCGAGWFEVASMTPYIRFVANNGAATTDGEWWRLLTSVFVHYGMVHLLLNAWALFQSGHLVERLFGRSIFAVIYLGSGVMGGFTTLFWKGDRVWSAGASGAVFGVYGALIGYLLREKKEVPGGVFKPLLTSALVFAAYNLLYGAANPRIDNAAHLGGLLTGAVLGWCCALPLDLEQRARLRPMRLRLAIGLVGLGIVLGVIFAPRFDYRVRDELAWRDLVPPLVKQEAETSKREQAALLSFARNGEVTALARWLNTEGIPFYENWRRQLDTLDLAPHRSTNRRRDLLRRLLQLKIDAYRRLATDAAVDGDLALARFREAQKQISDAAKAKTGK